MREEIVGGQKALDSMLFDPSGVEQENRGGPRRLIAFTVFFERLPIILHVDAGGKKIVVHEAYDAFIRPHLGIQPSTATSHRGGAEVQECGFLLCLGVLEDLFHIVLEIDLHA